MNFGPELIDNLPGFVLLTSGYIVLELLNNSVKLVE